MEQEKQKLVRVTKETNHAPYRTLLDISYRSLENAKAKGDGWGLECLTSITFSALAFEALVNTVGVLLIPHWKECDSSHPAVKYRLICNELDFELDLEGRVYQTIVWLVNARNHIVHAKFRSLPYEEELPADSYEDTFYDPVPTKFDELGRSYENWSA